MDLSRLKAPLSTLIEMGQNYVEVYPNDEEKPMIGQELNRVCLVTLGGLKRMNKDTFSKRCKRNGC